MFWQRVRSALFPPAPVEQPNPFRRLPQRARRAILANGDVVGYAGAASILADDNAAGAALRRFLKRRRRTAIDLGAREYADCDPRGLFAP